MALLNLELKIAVRVYSVYCIVLVNPLLAKLPYLIFSHLKLCVAITTHNFNKRVKITHICLIWDGTFAIFYL